MCNNTDQMNVTNLQESSTRAKQSMHAPLFSEAKVYQVKRHCLPYRCSYLQAVSLKGDWNGAPCCIKERQIATLVHDRKCPTVWEPIEACNLAAPLAAC